MPLLHLWNSKSDIVAQCEDCNRIVHLTIYKCTECSAAKHEPMNRYLVCAKCFKGHKTFHELERLGSK